MFSRYRNAFRKKRSKRITFFSEIESGCSRELLQLGFASEVTLIPGGVKVSVSNENHPPLQKIAHLPIFELDLSSLPKIDYSQLSEFKLIGLSVPRGSFLDCSSLKEFDLLKFSAEECEITNPEAMNHRSLRDLSLAKTNLFDLDFFKGKNLEKLNIEETEVRDLEFLSQQRFLKKLNLFNVNL